MIDVGILFEDDALLVINKPPGVVVNRAQSVQGETVTDWASSVVNAARFPSLSDADADFVQREGIVHRLDKETSGCLLIAKTPAVFLLLQAQFQERVIEKTYLAICHGVLPSPDGEICAPVGRLPWNRERFGIVPGGKESITRYVVTKTFERNVGKKKDTYSLVELYPKTGRTHQIRVHLQYIHHPIVGDWQYAGRKTARSDRVWAPRVMLHAWKISFVHPVTKERLAIEAPIPDDMRSIL